MAKEWSWLKGGIALGLLSAFAFLTYKPLGVSTSYPRTVALILNPFASEFVESNAYFQTVRPVIDWQWMLVIGIIIGGFIASRVVRRTQVGSCSTGTGTPEASKTIPTLAEGDAPEGMTSRRKWMGFVGGFLVLFGARLAGGCTSGHVITGFTQLATASFIFAGAVFAAGIPTAMLLRRKGWI